MSLLVCRSDVTFPTFEAIVELFGARTGSALSLAGSMAPGRDIRTTLWSECEKEGGW